MSEQVVAYAFLPSEGAQQANTATCYYTSYECRNDLQSASASVQAVVCAPYGEISPINLAAALIQDVPDRDVYLLEQQPTSSLVNRSRLAGIRGIINHQQMARMLGDMTLSPQPARYAPVLSNLLPLPATPARTGPADAVVSSPQLVAPPPVQPEAGGEAGVVVGVFSGRGGVGKSTLTVMLAALAYLQGLRVALLDLDLQFGDIGFLVGHEDQLQCQRLNLAVLPSQLPGVEAAAPRFLLVEAPEHPEEAEAHASELTSTLSRLSASYDLVLLNTGSFWNGTHAVIARACDFLILLMDQRLSSIQGCKRAVELCERLEVPSSRLLYALNGCGRNAAISVADASLALGNVELLALRDGGRLVDELLSIGCPLELAGSANPFSVSVAELLHQLLPACGSLQPEAQPTRPSQVGQLFNLSAFAGIFRGLRNVAS
ncbi:MAG: P-loop NTPase [Coriobacteriales bacterium]|nr:P-loop NTPase [Coriobacteriales bacterium]